MSESLTSGYSPPISMELQVGGERFSIASLGGERMILDDARSLPPSAGVVRIVVDGEATVYEVELPQGIDAQRRDQVIRVVRSSGVSAVA